MALPWSRVVIIQQLYWPKTSIPPDQLGSATAFNALMRQLARTIGITLAGTGLQIGQEISGTEQILSAVFPPIFVLMAGIALLSTFWWLRLTGQSGHTLLERSPIQR